MNLGIFPLGSRNGAKRRQFSPLPSGFYIGGAEAERRMRKNRGAESAERDWGWERVSPLHPSQPTGGLMERRELPSGVRDGRPTHFWPIWIQQNTSGRENSVILASFFFKKSTQSTIGGMALFAPTLWLRPCSPLYTPLAEN